ncbi:STAS domain-containing protein [Nonomuraea sp. NPDC002799]
MTRLDISTVHHPGHFAHPGHTVLSMVGELDAMSRAELERLLDRLCKDGHHRIIVDVSELTFCDSGGLRLLLLSTQRFFATGGWFRLRGLSSVLTRLAGLLRVRRQAVADGPSTYILASDILAGYVLGSTDAEARCDSAR